MKNLVILLTALFISHITETGAQTINGIGLIQLGKSEADILSDLKIESKSILEGETRKVDMLNKKTESSVIRLKFNPTSVLVKDLIARSSGRGLISAVESSRIPLQMCDEATVYLIPKYEIANTALNHFTLVFLKGKLIKISVDQIAQNNENEEFMTVFKAKFGNGTKAEEKRIYYGRDNTRYPIYDTVWDSGSADVLVKLTNSPFSLVPKQGYGGRLFQFEISNQKEIKALESCNSNGKSSEKNAILNKLNEL